MSEGKPRRKRNRAQSLDASREAKRRGSVILEVLAGLRSPTEASALLGLSPQRYYKLEARAVEGLLQALEAPAERRRRTRPDKELARVTSERDRLQRELTRAQSLVRLTQRNVGLPASGASSAKGAKGGKRRKPRVRARRLAEQLREEASGKGATSPAQPPQPSTSPDPTTSKPTPRRAS